MELRRVKPDDPAQKEDPTVYAVDIQIGHEEALNLVANEIEDPSSIEEWINLRLRKEVPDFSPLWFNTEVECIPGGIRVTTWSVE